MNCTFVPVVCHIVMYHSEIYVGLWQLINLSIRISNPAIGCHMPNKRVVVVTHQQKIK